jgi:multifunctional methyltransferase subunit TRM112
MRLITHNMLQCHVKGCTENNFPLRIVDPEVESNPVEFNEEFIARMLCKVEWDALLATSKEVSVDLCVSITKIHNDLVSLAFSGRITSDYA